ncbi:hypothetical protein QPK32_10890 [Massilia sp. YIM B02763]|uniref:hypothetical protein n=1 Tax=Massilia sp. YIM B02763 TaxID=3050130 RepID=UPI0025B67063|nr:hypothetical protein [Massilia sp. YIM B02763]MDN4053585.1 hypothetical protein [Massilia sp. YIM B02763]
MISSSNLPSDEALARLAAAPPFYVVSKRKLAILYLATFTLYTFYWFYKNWACYKGKHPEASRFGTTVWPVPRAVFPMFFTHALLRKVKVQGGHLPPVAAWHSGWTATFMVVWMILSAVIDLPLEGTAGDLVSIAAMFPLLLPLLQAQRMINLVCGDPAGAGNDRLTKRHYAVIAVGSLAWIATVAGLFLPPGA